MADDEVKVAPAFITTDDDDDTGQDSGERDSQKGQDSKRGDGKDESDSDRQDRDDSKTSNEGLRAELKRARQDAVKERRARKKLETEFGKFKTGIASALGIDNGEEKDNDDLRSEIRELRQEIRGNKTTKAVERAARKAKADPDLVHAVLKSEGSLKGLDPTDTDAIAELVDEALESHPSLRASAQRNTGDDHGQRGGGGKKTTPGATMNQIIRRAAGRRV